MLNIFQRHWHASTRFSPPKPETAAVNEAGRQPELELLAETIYGDTDCEVGARLRLDPYSFVIKEATWETYLLPVTITDLPGLRGEVAYFGIGPALTRALAGLGPVARTVFSETIGCIILSEPFLVKERGFASYAAYREYWDIIYLNACLYYSSLDTASELWDYSAYTRTSGLFNRFASQFVYALPGGGLRVVGAYRDTFHEINVEFELAGNLTVTRADGVMLRTPHAICPEAAVYLPQLVGQDATKPAKKQLAQLLGQCYGCVHLIDTVYDALIAVNMAANRSSGQAAKDK